MPELLRPSTLAVCLLVLATATVTASDTAIRAAPEDGGPRHWEVQASLNLRELATTTAPVVTTYPVGTILTNMGCSSFENRIWCYVQEFGGGPVGYVAAEFLAGAVSPDGSVATGPDNSAMRAGQGDFDATGKLPCAAEPAVPMQQCDFGVARAGGGYATVVVTLPGATGRKRAIFFQRGIAISADTSEADYSGKFRVEREGDMSRIHVGKERYEIVDAVALGG
jgi:hypothetical protein